LVIGGRSREAAGLAGQWLSERLNRTVLTPDGEVWPGVGGSLFVDSGQGSGWVRFQPGRQPSRQTKRYPRPDWDGEAVWEPFMTSGRCVAEPIPGGLWIRPLGHDARQAQHRVWLTQGLPCQPDKLTVVLGVPHCPSVSLDDAARAWMRLPETVRPRVRFVEYGPVSTPGRGVVGQELADLLGVEVACFTGMPVGEGSPPAVYTVGPDGRLGWQAFVRELAYQPNPSTSDEVPTMLSHRRPVHGMDEVAPAVYWWAPDAVVEVVQGGLWVRPPYEVAHADMVRGTRLVPFANQLVFDEPGAAGAVRMRQLAEDLRARLDEHTRQQTEVVAVSSFLARRPVRRTSGTPSVASGVERRAIAGGSLDPSAPEPATEVLTRVQPADEPVAPVFGPVRLRLESQAPPDQAKSFQLSPQSLVPIEKATVADAGVEYGAVEKATVEKATVENVAVEEAPVEERAVSAVPERRTEVRFQPTPTTEASALTRSRGMNEERAWLRRNLGPQYGTIANAVARILSEHPGFRGALSKSKDEVLTDAVAVRLYLSPQGASVDEALCTVSVGPHVPFARCVVAGLDRLPSHRGPSVFTASPTAEELRLYRQRRVLTEWGFTHALSSPCAGTEGTYDVLLWAMTARRTRLLEPEAEHTEDRLLFVPGTSFKLLSVVEPVDGARGQILLRELAASEIDEDGRVDPNRASLDELAGTSLRRQAELWATEEHRRRITEADSDRFGRLPGLAWVA
jgi:hypothetical protein